VVRWCGTGGGGASERNRCSGLWRQVPLPSSVVRFRLIYGSHPATVLIYAHGNQSIATLGSAKLQSTIKDAGIKLQTADSPSQLDEALKLRKADVVIAGLADIAGIARQLQEAPSK
jgi:hypothetical protein